MPLHIPGDPHATSVRSYDGAFGDCLGRVVGPFAVDLRAQSSKQRLHSRSSEHHDGSNSFQGGYQPGTVSDRNERPSRSAESAGGSIIVDRHDEEVAEMTGGTEVPHMSDMKWIEETIRQDHAQRWSSPPHRSHVVEERSPGEDPRGRVAHARPSSEGSLSIAIRNSPGATVAVPRFMTTRPPA